MIDADLAADGAIDHRQERGRDHQQRNAARVGCGGEARKVADDAAADRDDERLPIGGEIDEGIVKLGSDVQGFLGFARRTNYKARAKAGLRETIFHGLGVNQSIFIGDDKSRGSLGTRPREGAELMQRISSNNNIVACVHRDGRAGFDRSSRSQAFDKDTRMQ